MIIKNLNFLCIIFTLAFAGQPYAFAVETATPVGSGENSTQLMGFQTWKEKRISKARQDLALFQSAPQQEERTAEATSAASDKAEPGDSIDSKASSLNGEDSQVQNENNPTPEQLAELTRQLERLRQLEFNLEIAQGLTIHDFFALYLKDKSKTEMGQIVSQLKPEEISELLISYREALYGSSTLESPQIEPGLK